MEAPSDGLLVKPNINAKTAKSYLILNNTIKSALNTGMAVLTAELAGEALFFCLQLHADEANGSIQWKMTHQSRLYVKTADNCNNSYSFLDTFR